MEPRMTDYATILVEQRGAVTLVTLNRPQALNALNTDVLADLSDAFGSYDKDESQRCLVLTGSAAAPSPPPDKRRGFRSGWQVGYLKGTPEKPVSAYALIYVYATAADAKRAYARSCAACSTEIEQQGIDMKLQLTAGKGTPGVLGIAACRNVYIAIGISGQVPANTLAESAGALIGGVYAKAMASGMSPCTLAR